MNTTKIYTEQNSTVQTSNDVGFYRAKQAAQLLGVSNSTFWLWSQQGAVKGVKVPKPVKLSAGVTVWKRSEIHSFLEQLAALGDKTPPEAA